MRPPWLTIGLLGLIAAIALVVGSPWSPIEPDLIRTFGFAPADLRSWQWHRLATSLPLTSAPGPFWKTVFLVALACGICERREGPRHMVTCLVAFHVGVLVLTALVILPWVHAGADWALAIDRGYDVGPSDGAYGCLGLALPDLRAVTRRLVVGGFTVVTLLNLSVHVQAANIDALSGDAGHIAALGVGLAVATWTWRRRRVRESACA